MLQALHGIVLPLCNWMNNSITYLALGTGSLISDLKDRTCSSFGHSDSYSWQGTCAVRPSILSKFILQTNENLNIVPHRQAFTVSPKSLSKQKLHSSHLRGDPSIIISFAFSWTILTDTFTRSHVKEMSLTLSCRKFITPTDSI